MKKQSLFNKKIPTLFAVIIITIGIGLVSLINGKINIFQSGATPNEIPQNIRVTNITDTAFTITYTTETATIGTISFGKDKALGTILLDERDQTNGILHPSTIHSMTAKTVLPNTTYYFSIISGGKTYQNNTTPFTATTGPPITNTDSSQKIISGTVTPLDKTIKRPILVYLQTQNGQIISTTTDDKGNYYLLLTKVRTADFSRYITLHLQDQLTITYTDGLALSHIITTIQNSQAIPAITLGQDYDFTNAISPSTTPPVATSLGFPLFNSATISTNLAILVPQKNETFIDAQPEFSGTAQPNELVTITIYADKEITTTVIADNKGQWIFRPKTSLPSGSHTITIATTNTSENVQSRTQTFTIFPSGSQVFQIATPTATIVPKITTTPTNTPALTITVSPTVVVTPTTLPTQKLSMTPTTIPSLSPTTPMSPTITKADTPTPTSITMIIPAPTKTPLPSTGNASIITIGIMSIITTITGIVLFFII